MPIDRDTVIRMAEAAGFRTTTYNTGRAGVVDSDGIDIDEELTRFASLIEAEAVERCAQIAENTEAGDGSHDWNAGAATMQERIADAIRNLKEEGQ